MRNFERLIIKTALLSYLIKFFLSFGAFGAYILRGTGTLAINHLTIVLGTFFAWQTIDLFKKEPWIRKNIWNLFIKTPWVSFICY